MFQCAIFTLIKRILHCIVLSLSFSIRLLTCARPQLCYWPGGLQFTQKREPTGGHHRNKNESFAAQSRTHVCAGACCLHGPYNQLIKLRYKGYADVAHNTLWNTRRVFEWLPVHAYCLVIPYQSVIKCELSRPMNEHANRCDEKKAEGREKGQATGEYWSWLVWARFDRARGTRHAPVRLYTKATHVRTHARTDRKPLLASSALLFYCYYLSSQEAGYLWAEPYTYHTSYIQCQNVRQLYSAHAVEARNIMKVVAAQLEIVEDFTSIKWLSFETQFRIQRKIKQK